MADYSAKDVSNKYLASIENVPVETVAFGIFLLVVFLGFGYALSVKYNRWKFKRRQAARRKELEKQQPTTKGCTTKVRSRSRT